MPEAPGRIGVSTVLLGPLRYVVDAREPAAAVVQPGDTVIIETEDAFSGQIRAAGDRRDRTSEPRSNPVNGPIHIAGALPGDAIVIHVKRIEPAIDQCATYVWPYAYTTATLGADVQDETRICAIHKGKIVWDATLSLPYRPMIGVIATAPASEVPSTEAAGDWGGNLDLREVAPDSTVLLPCHVPGGQLFLGDCHASQGDGEISAAALEMPAKVTLTVDVIRDANLAGPRILTPSELIAVAVERSLEEAVERAYGRLALWLESDYGLSRWEAYSLLTQVGSLTIGYFRLGVVGAKIARSLIPAKRAATVRSV